MGTEVATKPLMDNGSIVLRYIYNEVSFNLLAYICGDNGEVFKAKLNSGLVHGLGIGFTIVPIANFKELADDHEKEFGTMAKLDHREKFERLTPYVQYRNVTDSELMNYQTSATAALGIARAFGMIEFYTLVSSHDRPASIALSELLCYLSEKINGWMDEERCITF